MMIKFVLLRFPLAALHDPETVIVHRMHRFMNVGVLDNLIHAPEILSAKPSLSEVLWNFSRYKDRARITLEQNPHFYSSLPADENAYTPTFKHHPLGDSSMALKPHDTIYVLIDRPGRVFIESEGERRGFGNVWTLNGTLIFKGLRHFSVSPTALISFQTALECSKENNSSEMLASKVTGGAMKSQ